MIIFFVKLRSGKRKAKSGKLFAGNFSILKIIKYFWFLVIMLLAFSHAMKSQKISQLCKRHMHKITYDKNTIPATRSGNFHFLFLC